MSKSGMNWLLTVAVAVAAGAIGAGVYYLSKEDTSDVAEAEKAVAKLEAAANGKVQLNSSGTQTGKAQADKAPEVTTRLDTAAAATDNTPGFDVMRVEPSGNAVVAGRAEAGSIVAIISNGDVIGKGIANNNGEFAIVLEKPLKPGDHDISLEATNQETQETNGSQQHIAVSVPEDETGEVLVVLNEPDAPSKVLQLPETPLTAEPVAVVNVDTPEPTVPVEVVAAQSPGAKEEVPAPVKVADEKATQAVAEAGVQTPASLETPSSSSAAAAAVIPQLSVKAVETEQGRVFIAGESEPGAKVRVYVGEEFVGEAQAGTKGDWLIEAEKTIPAGNVEVRADKVETADGKVAARAQVVFTKGENDVAMIPVRLVAEGSGPKGASASVGIGELPKVIIRRGDNLWTISRRLYGKGTRYTTIYLANSQQIHNPDLIFPGQVFMLPVTDLNWKTISN